MGEYLEGYIEKNKKATIMIENYEHIEDCRIGRPDHICVNEE